MEIKPVIFITLDNVCDSIITDVFECLNPEIRSFHKHIDSVQLRNGQNEVVFSEVISNTRKLNDTSNHALRHKSIGEFSCDLFFVSQNAQVNEIENLLSIFDKCFHGDNSRGAYEKMLFLLSNPGKKLNTNYYVILPKNVHGSELTEEELYDKIRYFFLFFLTSDLYAHDKVSTTNNAFYFAPNPSKAYFKSIALEYDGLPLFQIKDLYRKALKESYVRKIVGFEDEIDKESVKNKLSNVASLAVEELKNAPDKPKVSLKLSFFSSIRKRNENVASFKEKSAGSIAQFNGLYNNEAKKQRLDLETKIRKGIPNDTNRLIHEIFDQNKSLSAFRRLIGEITKDQGVISKLVSEKERDIVWKEPCKFRTINLKPTHPKWLIILIMAAAVLLSSLLPGYKYILFVIGVLAGYIVYSFLSLSRIRNIANSTYIKGLQDIQSFYQTSFKSFIKYIEVFILRTISRKFNDLDDKIAYNQAFFTAYYLLNFPNSKNYDKFKKDLVEYLSKEDMSKLKFARFFKRILVCHFKNSTIPDGVNAIIHNNDVVKSCLSLIDILDVQNSSGSIFQRLADHSDKDKMNALLIEKIYSEVEKLDLFYSPIDFLQKIDERYLKVKFEECFLRNANNYSDLVSNIASDMNYEYSSSVNRLLRMEKNKEIHYLHPFRKTKDQPFKLLFVPEINEQLEPNQYKSELTTICGYLYIQDLLLNQNNEH